MINELNTCNNQQKQGVQLFDYYLIMRMSFFFIMSFFNTHSICLLPHYRALMIMSFLSMIMRSRPNVYLSMIHY